MPFTAAGQPFEVDGVIGGSTQLFKDKQGNANAAGNVNLPSEKLTLEFSALRVFNIENFGKNGAGQSDSSNDVRKVDLRDTIVQN